MHRGSVTNCARANKSDFVQKAGHFHDLAGHLVKKRDCPAKSGTVGRSASSISETWNELCKQNVALDGLDK